MIKYSLVTMGLLCSFTAFSQSQSSVLGAWKGFSSPDIFDSGFTHVAADLPLEGTIQVGPKAWSGDYWASNKGGINYRWNAFAKLGFETKAPTQENVKNMTTQELAELAPSEKYDLLMGRYDYPLKAEAARSANRRAEEWAGICHGWAPATLYHNEPTPKELINPDGIVIPFGSADIKALISYYYAFYHDKGTTQMGLRCFFGSWMGGARGCADDLNAGAFHIVLTNKIGLQKEGFVMDLERFREVWNQPVLAYKAEVVAAASPPSKGSAKGTVKETRFKTTVFYLDESDSTWNVVHGTPNQMVDSVEFLYRVELNSQGKIIGGAWESSARPDFLWNVPKAKNEDYFGLLQELPKLLNDL